MAFYENTIVAKQDLTQKEVLTIKNKYNDLEFNVRPRGSHDYRRELFQNGDSLIGQKLTVIFQEYSADGIPRFPVGKAIRYDK